MPGPEFFQTVMGRRFFEGTMPTLVTQLKRIADSMEKNIDLQQTIDNKAEIEVATKKSAFDEAVVVLERLFMEEFSDFKTLKQGIRDSIAILKSKA